MKRIYITIGLLMTFAFGSVAQSVDLQAYIQRPAAGQTICAGEILDSSKVLTALFYHGPDDIYTGTDYVAFMTPFSIPSNDSMVFLEGVSFGADITSEDSGRVLITFPNNTEIGAGHIAPFTLSADSINYLYDWDLYNLNDSFVIRKPPYVAGQSYGFFMYARGIRDQNGGGAVATDPNPSNNRAVVKIVWCSGVGIENMISANEVAKIEVYPNPATSAINFSFDFDKMSHSQAVLRDVTGRIVFVKNYGKAVPGTQKYSIDISNFAAGSYSLEFNTDEKTAITKFSIVK